MKEAINHPDHYNVGYEVIDFIEDYNLSFSMGNWLKYFCRYKYKGLPIQDFKKSLWYLKRVKSKVYFKEKITNTTNFSIVKFMLSWNFTPTEMTIFSLVMDYLEKKKMLYLLKAIKMSEELLQEMEDRAYA